MLFKSDIQWIKKSGLFDADYYLETNSDVKKTGINPLKHFTKYGWKEGRNPSTKFDTSFYLSTYADVKNAGMNPLVHYIKFGQSEGRLAKKRFQFLSFQEPWITNQTSPTEDVLNQRHSNILNAFESMLCHSSTMHIIIITPKHTLFVAHLLYKKLTETGFEIQIETTLPEKFNDNLYIMICPQIFDRMPERYIAFQMEQLMNSRWFNERYRMILQNSIAIFDYSVQNIEYLQNNGFSNKHLCLLPIAPFKGYRQFLRLQGHWDGGVACGCDVLFYGDTNNEHRQNYLRALQQKFSVKIINEVFGNDLYRELLSAKVIANIHYYENALLETTRIYECLSLGLRVVSEESSDMEEHLALLNQVDFVRRGDIEHMIEKITKVLDEDEKKEKEKEKVSVIIPCYNQAAYIQETVESVLDQTYSNIEIIIVNDGSIDDSEQIIQEISRCYPDKNIRLITQQNKGLSEARNSGIKAASANYLFLLDGDDKLHKTMISKCMNVLMQNDVDIVYADYQRFGEINTAQCTRDNVDLYFIQYANITGATALYKKSVWEKNGGYKQNMHGGYEDWEFWINATKNSFRFYHIPEVLFYYRVKKESMYTDALTKHTYLYSKIVMNHPELYTDAQQQNAINSIKAFECAADLYFYFDKNSLFDEKEMIPLIGDFLSNKTLDNLIDLEEKLITFQSEKYGAIELYNLSFMEKKDILESIATKPDICHAIFYSELRYHFADIDTLKSSHFAWSFKKGFVEVKGTSFPLVRRNNLRLKIEAYQRSEQFLQEKCERLERDAGYYVQLFLNFGNGYNEISSLLLPVLQHNELQTFTFVLTDYTNLTNLRFDPLNDSCVIEIEELKVLRADNTELNLLRRISANDCIHHSKSYFFDFHDPQMTFEGLNADELVDTIQLTATIRYTHIARDALHHCYKQILLAKDNKIQELAQKIEELGLSKK